MCFAAELYSRAKYLQKNVAKKWSKNIDNHVVVVVVVVIAAV